MRTTIFTVISSLMLLSTACNKEPAKDADPCAAATANARRLASAEPRAAETFGAEPLSLERCRKLTSKQEVACLGYASSWDELAACSPGALRPSSDIASKP